ncbi:CU044_5270 family protein [Rhizohabitans arisaemae]|uniref:CU044_5270 family protein n=1 Tax=Rhizohabitans arisaemae TaxID=2720610 RepID=UPI0024B14C38|nr:CU044_5270 family protein [Rhizohabitans arisaemae]
MNDEMSAVRKLLAEEPPSDRVVAAGRARLLHAQDGRTRRSRTALRSARWTTLGVGLLGAAAAVTMVMVNGTAPVTSVGGTDRPVVTQPVPARLSAKDILLAAATKVEKSQADGTYWLLKVRTDSQRGLAEGYWIEQSYSNENWIARSTSKSSWGITQNLGVRPATPADEEAWRKAGSPDSWKIVHKIPAEKAKIVGKKTSEEIVNSAAGKPEAWRLDDGGRFGWLVNGPVTEQEIRRLPDDPEKLRAYIQEKLDKFARSTGSTTNVDSPHLEMYSELGRVITGLPVTPEVRAAAYRAMASLPGVSERGEATDSLGRTGQLIVFPAPFPTGEYEHRLLIDRETGVALWSETVVVRPDTQAREPQRAGQTLHSTLIEKVGWTDDEPEIPADQRGPEDAKG